MDSAGLACADSKRCTSAEQTGSSHLDDVISPVVGLRDVRAALRPAVTPSGTDRTESTIDEYMSPLADFVPTAVKMLIDDDTAFGIAPPASPDSEIFHDIAQR